MPARDIAQNLYEIARSQQGLFTAAQAKEAGYSDSRFAYHLRRGHWVREGRGIYRLASYPAGDRPDLVRWSLWSANRQGAPQAVFSHATALVIHDLSDAMPSHYDLTVPRGFRKYRPPPESLRLHRTNLKDDEIWLMEGYRVTSPQRTITDIFADESIADNIAGQAIKEALLRGLLCEDTLERIRKSATNQERASRILKLVCL